MALSRYDSIKQKPVTDVERETYNAISEVGSISKQAAKEAAISARVTNDELKKLNATSSAILAANATLVSIQSQTLEESNKQTALLDAQLQIAKISELEKTRQTQIKQAAFSVDQQITEIGKKESKLSQYFYFKDELIQVELVGLTPDAPNEISDKQYVRDILAKLNNEINHVKSSLTQDEIRDIDTYYVYVDELANSREFKQRLLEDLGSTPTPKEPNVVTGILMQTIYPKFFKNKKFNNALACIYYIFILLTSGFGLILGAASYFIVRGKLQKEYLESLHSYNEKNQNIKDADENISRLQLFLSEFKKKYSLPA